MSNTTQHSKYEAVIGLEIHAELMTQSKMFCGCQVVDSVEAAPNTAVCPVCLGMPGMLPVINRRAIEYAMRVALALNCEIQPHNVFSRKSYFYPDLPKSYQISQYDLPIGLHGWLDVETEGGESKRIRIRRVHMEEDTGKLTHVGNGRSLVDYNRSGVPLLEIVSEPDIRSGEEARAYAVKIRQILRYLGVNSGDMEKGVLRVEPNISIRPVGNSAYGTRTELKNLNSFRVLCDGTDFEIARQTKVLDAGESVVQETRGWHEKRRVTFSQRLKEEAEDYRYLDEPDLPPLHLDAEWIAATRAALPELADAKMDRYINQFGLSAYNAQVLAEDRVVAEWFETAVAQQSNPKTVANWIINDLFRLMNEHKQSISQIKVTPKALIALISLVEKQTINSNTAKDVLAEMITTGETAQNIVEAHGWAQLSDQSELIAIIQTLFDDNPGQVAAYLGGRDKLRGWFMGQVMRATRGKGNPKVVNQLLDKAFDQVKT